MEQIYDLLVLGGGPAGLAAGMYGARARMKTAIIEEGKPGGQAATTEDLRNYPGFGRVLPDLDLPGYDRSCQLFGAEFIKDTISIPGFTVFT